MSHATQVGPDTVVTLAYTLYGEDGEVIESTGEGDPGLEYVHGYGQIVPGLERAVEGMVAGQERSVVVQPADAYGDYDDEGVFEVSREDFPEPDQVKVDDEFVAEGDDGDQLALRVVEIRPEGFLVDANHPLAGENLKFDLEVLDVRPATAAEIAEAEEALDEGEGGCCDDPSHHHGEGDDHADHAASDVVPLGRKPAKTPPTGGAT